MKSSFDVFISRLNTAEESVSLTIWQCKLPQLNWKEKKEFKTLNGISKNCETIKMCNIHVI